MVRGIDPLDMTTAELLEAVADLCVCIDKSYASYYSLENVRIHSFDGTPIPIWEGRFREAAKEMEKIDYGKK